MKLTFGNFSIVASDALNFELIESIKTVPKIGANKGTEVQSSVGRGYYGDLRSALSALAKRQIDIGEDFPALYDKLDDLQNWIKAEVLPFVPKLEKTGKRGRTSASETFELAARQ